MLSSPAIAYRLILSRVLQLEQKDSDVATLKTRNHLVRLFDTAACRTCASAERKVGAAAQHRHRPDLHKALKRRALEEDRTVSDILRDLIERYLSA